MRKIPVLLLILLAANCGKGGMLIDRALPKEEVKTSAPGELIFSASNLERELDRNRLTIMHWKFKRLEAGQLVLEYLEFYDQMKEKPDLDTEKKFPISNEINTGTFTLHLYQLSGNSMTYRITIAPRKT